MLRIVFVAIVHISIKQITLLNNWNNSIWNLKKTYS